MLPDASLTCADRISEQSDWSGWLPAEIAATDPAGVTIWHLCCNEFALKGGDRTILFIDPYLGTGDPDAVLATHERLRILEIGDRATL